MRLKLVRTARLFRLRVERLEDRCLLSAGPVLPSSYGQIPLSFEVNQGQTNAQVDYLAHGQGYGIFLSKTDAVLSLTNAKGSGNAIRMHLVGDNSAAPAIGLDEQSGVSNYFIGNNSSQWHPGIANYGQVEYQNVYPGIDVLYYGNQQQLEYDFHVAPGADPNAIQLAFEGATGVTVDGQGQLLVHTSGGNLTWSAPVLYQETATGRQSVSGQFVVTGPEQVGFAVGAYNPSLPLVIDPFLSYSTFLVGNNGSKGNGIAVDGAGHAYVTGYTTSSNFPTTTGTFQTTNPEGAQLAFVSEMNLTGTGLVYSTYLGGSWGYGRGIAVDAFGDAFVMGTAGNGFPTTPGAFQTTGAGVFVTELNPTGTGLVYSTYLGDGGVGAIAVNAAGDAFLTGQAGNDFPTTPGAFQTTTNWSTVFVTELNPTGTGLVYSTLIGGNGVSAGEAIAADAVGHAFVTGFADTSNFPTTPGAFQTTFPGGGGFLTELNTTGTGLVYSTYLGDSTGSGIAVDAVGHAFVTGEAGSGFHTTPGAFQTTNPAGSGGGSAFVTELNTTGTGLVYSTFLGGNNNSFGYGIAVDAAGYTYVTGYTIATNFPTTLGAFQTTNLAGVGNNSAFVTELNPTGTGLVYSTYLGGSGDSSQGSSIALDSAADIFVTGFTSASNFPTTPGAFQTSYPGMPSAFVARFNVAAPTVTGLNPITGSTTGGTIVTITGTGFTSPSTVEFGTNPATNVTVNSAGTQITATDPAGSPGVVNVTVATPGDGTSATSSADQFTYVMPTFQVTSTTLLPGDNGFLLTFNFPYNIAQLNLYTGDSGETLGARSVQITGPNGATFGGSAPDTMRFNAVPVDSTQLEFILTGLNHVEAAQVLAPGSYTLTLDGGSNDPAFERLSDGAYLDGNGDGTITPVDNYTSTLTVSAIPASTDVVSIGDLVAGPGQTVPVPLVLSGGTGSVSDTTTVSLTIAAPADGAYTVLSFAVNNLMIAGVSANFNPVTGQLTISSATPFAPTENPLLLGTFTFAVAGLGNPGTTPGIDTKTPINITITNVTDNAFNPKPFIGVNSFHVSAYIGNLSAPVGVYNSTDVSQLQGFIIGTVKAFALYPNLDPLLLADVNKDGSVNGADVSQFQARILGLPSSIPALPLGSSGVAVNGADPVLFVGTSYTPNGQPANLGSLTPSSTVLVPLSVFVTDPAGVNVTAAEVAFCFDPKVFALNGVSAGAIAGGNLGGNPFSIAFSEANPGEVNVIGSSNVGPNLVYGRTATLFLVSLTVRPAAPAGATVFNLMGSEGGLQTGLQDNLGRNLVLAPAPENLAGDNLDGSFTVLASKPVQQQVEGLSGKTAMGDQKQAGPITALAPAAWEQLTTLLFEGAANQSILNSSNGSLAMAATPPVTAVAESKKQTGSVESLQSAVWEQLTTDLFKFAANQTIKSESVSLLEE